MDKGQQTKMEVPRGKRKGQGRQKRRLQLRQSEEG